MAHGTGSGGGKPTTFFKIKGLKEEEEDLYFLGKVKEGDKYVEIPTKPTYIQGVVTEIKTDSYEYKGVNKFTIKITFEDGNSRDILEMNIGSNMSTGIINTLAGCESINDVRIELYTSAKGYASPSIKLDRGKTKAEWAWDYKKVIAPKIKTVMVGEEKHTDKSKLIDFLVKEVGSEAFQAKVTGVVPEGMDTPTPKESLKEQPEAEVDNLPF